MRRWRHGKTQGKEKCKHACVPRPERPGRPHWWPRTQPQPHHYSSGADSMYTHPPTAPVTGESRECQYPTPIRRRPPESLASGAGYRRGRRRTGQGVTRYFVEAPVVDLGFRILPCLPDRGSTATLRPRGAQDTPPPPLQSVRQAAWEVDGKHYFATVSRQRVLRKPPPP